MKKSSILFAVAVAILMNGCTKDSHTPSVTALVVNISAFPVGDSSDKAWFFASDKSGNSLGAQTIKIGTAGTLTFNSSSPVDSVTFSIVTQFNESFVDNPTSPQVTILSYSGIPGGSILSIAPTAGYPGGPDEINVSVTGYNVNTYVTDPDGLLISNENNNSIFAPSGTDEEEVSSFYLNKMDTAGVLISGYNASKLPVYYWFHPPAGQLSYSVGFADFKSYPKTISLPNQGYVAGTIYAHKSNNLVTPGYLMSSFSWDATSSFVPTVGYLDGFSSYKMNIFGSYMVNNVTYDAAYYKQGAIATSVQFPNSTYSVVSSDFATLGFETSSPYTMKYTTYYSTPVPDHSSVSWYRYSPTGSPGKITEIPSDITTQFPQIQISNLKYNSTYFMNYVDGKTYAQLLKYILANVDPDQYEYYTFRQN